MLFLGDAILLSCVALCECCCCSFGYMQLSEMMSTVFDNEVLQSSKFLPDMLGKHEYLLRDVLFGLFLFISF